MELRVNYSTKNKLYSSLHHNTKIVLWYILVLKKLHLLPSYKFLRIMKNNSLIFQKAIHKIIFIFIKIGIFR